MDVWVVIGAIGLVIGIVAGIVQIVEYLQRRREMKAIPVSSTEPSKTQTENQGINHKLSPFPVFPPRKVYHNLPHPDCGEFVGREDELAKITDLLSAKNLHFLVTITGISGIGKSALALEVAHRYLRDYEQILPEERFDAIIWISAKLTALTAEGIMERKQALRTLRDMFATISITLEREDIIRSRPERQNDLVRRALSHQRTLLIVDNLEVVDDQAVMEFLRELPTPSKAIVTTRRRIDVANPLRLVEMSWEDARALMIKECEKKGVKLSNSGMRDLYDRISGIPLAIVWSIAQMGFGYDAETVLAQLTSPSSDITRFCFESIVRSIQDTDAYRLLMILSLFPVDASRQALELITGNLEGKQDLEESLVNLEKLSLVSRRANRCRMLPLTQRFARYKLDATSDFRNRVVQSQAQHYKQFIEGLFGVDYWGNYFRRDQWSALDIEYYNLREVIALAVGREDWETVLVIGKGIVHYLEGRGLWEERLQIGKVTVTAARELGDYETEAWFRGDALSWIYYQRGEYDAAIAELKSCKEIAQNQSLYEIFALSESFLADIAAKRGNIEGACSTLERLASLKLPVFTQNRVKRRLATVLTELGQYDEAENLYREVLSASRLASYQGVESTSGVSLTLRQYGGLLLKVGRLREARESLGEALELEQSVRRVSGIAYANLGLARVAAREGHNAEALSLASEARGSFDRLGMEQEVALCEQLLTSISSDAFIGGK